MKSISLFSSGGIGDLALKDLGIEHLVANEIIKERAEVYKHNFPNTEMLIGDIWELKDDIIRKTRAKLNGDKLDILFATPPCQGMSKNGRGKLLNGIRAGVKPKLDERNQLIVPVVEIIKELKPTLVVFENVPEMKDTLIYDRNGEELINLIEFVSKELKGYSGNAEVVEFANYGVPQKRQRLITVFTKDKGLISEFKKRGGFLPETTHAKEPSLVHKKWITVGDAIANTPPLSGKTKEEAKFDDIPHHYVPVLDEKKYFWVSNTPPERGAFDNQCVNSKCEFQDNPTHGAKRGKDGINRSSRETPIRCIKCGELLPRPWTEKNGEFHLMKGFTSAYKRMSWGLPASALTRNLSYACSDHKLHPDQHRVLSLYEAFTIHTVSDFDYDWTRADGKKVSDKLIREIIGESIPPRGLRKIFTFLINSLNSKSKNVNVAKPSFQKSKVDQLQL